MLPSCARRSGVLDSDSADVGLRGQKLRRWRITYAVTVRCAWQPSVSVCENERYRPEAESFVGIGSSAFRILAGRECDARL